MEFETLVLIFIRAHRIRNFDLYVASLEALVPWFFALDHVNYARWVPIHIRDMKSLSPEFREQFVHYWALPKTSRKFSCMPLDQAHEQNNDLIKNYGGAVALTDNFVFKRWLVAGPEQVRILAEFDNSILDSKDNEHHANGPASENMFKTEVQNLCTTVSTMGNPFLTKCPELLQLDTHNCALENVAISIRTTQQFDSNK